MWTLARVEERLHTMRDMLIENGWTEARIATTTDLDGSFSLSVAGYDRSGRWRDFTGSLSGREMAEFVWDDLIESLIAQVDAAVAKACAEAA